MTGHEDLSKRKGPEMFEYALVNDTKLFVGEVVRFTGGSKFGMRVIWIDLDGIWMLPSTVRTPEIIDFNDEQIELVEVQDLEPMLTSGEVTIVQA